MAETKKPQPKKDKKVNQAIIKAEPVGLQKPEEKKTEKVVGEVLPPEAMEKMPPEVRQTLQAYFAMVSKTTSGPRPNPLFEKFTPEHIDKYLDYVQRDDDHAYDMARTNRWFYLMYSCIAVGAFVFAVIYLLPIDRDLLMQLIMILVALAGGVGAGFGLSKKK